jgi:hypothetical protein
MLKVRPIFRRLLLIVAALSLVGTNALPAFADDPAPAPDPSAAATTPTDTTAPPTDTATTPVATITPAPGPAANPGPAQPQGPDANTYTYDSNTGLWSNQYYTWNPATGQTTPSAPQTYSYNPATGHWDTTDWIYNPASGAYIPNVVSVDQPPAGALTLGGPTDVSTAGPNSPIGGGGSSTGVFDNFYNAAISNSIVARALSGNANVSINTTGGSAASGNAMDLANIINLLQSTTNLQGNLATFNMNIAGNVQGDITIDPSQLGNTTPVGSNNLPNNLTINNQANGQINNNIDLAAASGNATVDSNTTAGNATTGNADAIANIMNVINSIISSGQSFVGNINIFGNLDGDILMPQDTLNNLLASGGSTSGNSASTAGPNSPIDATANNTLTATLTDNNAINNTLDLTAHSGGANVTNNTTAGNAITGNAGTNLTVLNLTGKQIIGNDALLVFVNVLGKWVGMIVNAPAGASSAALCNCSSASTEGPNSPINANAGTNTNLNSTNNSNINNNVRLASNSGDATVSNNTTAGNATSGNATASLNLLNISTSSLNLSHWLGILFINVFGSWNGSFGIDTAAGNPAVAQTSGGGQSSTGPTVTAVKVFGFTPHNGSHTTYNVVPLAAAANPADPDPNPGHAVVLASTSHTTPPSQPKHSSSMLLTVGALAFVVGAVTAEETYFSRKQANQSKIRKFVQGVTVQPLKKF